MPAEGRRRTEQERGFTSRPPWYGIRDSVSGQITDLGPNIITVSPGSESGGGGGPVDAEMVSTLIPKDTENIAALPSAKAASSNVSTGALVNGKSVQFWGVDPPTTRSAR